MLKALIERVMCSQRDSEGRVSPLGNCRVWARTVWVPPSASGCAGMPPALPRRAAQRTAARDRYEKKTRREENSLSADPRREECGVWRGLGVSVQLKARILGEWQEVRLEGQPAG